MKRIAYFFIGVSFLMLGFTNQDKKKIIFFGDSITAIGSGRGGYIRKLDTLLQQKGLNNNYELIGAGVGGNKIYHLYLRMEEDVLAKNPDVVVIWIGVNDVWHKRSQTGTEAGDFDRFYSAIVKKMQDKGIRVIICTPAAIGEKKFMENEQDKDLNRYAQIARDVAQKFNCPLIDFRSEFTEYLKGNNPDNKDKGILTVDGVHLSRLGNELAAEKIYEVLVK